MLLLMARPDCPLCGGTGWKIVEGENVVSPAAQRVSLAAAAGAEGEGAHAFALRKDAGAGGGMPRVAMRCECTEPERKARAFARARIPQRYEACDFENFETDIQYGGADDSRWCQSLRQAKLLVEGFARDYPAGTEHGLLLMGPCGTGKTHLAVAALKEIVCRGHNGLFYDYRELLKEIQASYAPDRPASELDVLEPVLEAEVLLLDDLGAMKPSLWVLETVGHILNHRYNEKRMTLVTTNFLDLEDGPGLHVAGAARPAAEDSLTDRIGKRIRSRLFEMCRTVEVVAPDYRKEIRQAGRFRA